MVESIIPSVKIDFYSDDFDPRVLPYHSKPFIHSFVCGCLRFNLYLHKVCTLNIAPQMCRRSHSFHPHFVVNVNLF